jgi:hypothetical protein
MLRGILEDPRDTQVRSYLISSVVSPLGDRRFVEQIWNLTKTERHEAVRRRALETYHELLSSAEPSAVTRLKEEVEQLKEENRKLAGSK